MLKVAIALSGLSRTSNITAASWGRIIGKYNADVYIHSWSDGSVPTDFLIDQFNWIYKPKVVKVDLPITIDTSLYKERILPYVDVYRSFSMWEGISWAHKLVKDSNKEYDIIIRGRTDLHIHDLNIIQFNGITIPYDLDKHVLKFNYQEKDLHGYNDHCAYGNMKDMDVYANLINEIQELFNEGVDFCPEMFLTASMVKNRIPVFLQHMEHCLIRRGY